MDELVAAYGEARTGGGTVVLEGLHAVKHALRFGEHPSHLVTDDRASVLALAAEVAPDVLDQLAAGLTELAPADFAGLVHRPPASPLLGIGRCHPADPSVVLGPGSAPVVVLEGPRHAGNVGAAIRVAAAADADGVLTTGSLDPWSAPVLRGAAGLHYALPVGRFGAAEATDAIPALATGRPVVALDPGGDLLDGRLPVDAVLLFGTERHGLSPGALARADHCVRLPMRAGVSSLNLATSVAAVLYGLRQ